MLFKRLKNESKKNAIESKFQLNEKVAFHYKDDLRYGYVYAIKESANNQVIYDIQIGGECPVVIKNVEENLIIKQKN